MWIWELDFLCNERIYSSCDLKQSVYEKVSDIALRFCCFVYYDENDTKISHGVIVRADVPYILRFLSHICDGFYIKRQTLCVA